MIDGLEKLTIAHAFYILGAGVAAGFLFVLVDGFILRPLEPMFGIGLTGPVI